MGYGNNIYRLYCNDKFEFNLIDFMNNFDQSYR